MPDSEAQAPLEAGALGLGERLRSARRAQALSLEQVCDALHLDEHLVIALEEERFDALGAPVFVRGHLKAYARLVGLSPDLVIGAYGGADPASQTQPRLPALPDRSLTINPVSWSIGGLVAILVIGLTVYVLQDDELPVATLAEVGTETAGAPPAPATAETPVLDDGPPGVNPITGAPGELRPSNGELPDAGLAGAVLDRPEGLAAPRSVPAGPAGDEPVASRAAEPAAPAADQPVRLGLYFVEESWVEISDANRRLLFGLQREDMRRDLIGEPPFELLLGNAAGVSLFINDDPFPVPAESINGNVARFAINADDFE